MPRLSRIVFVVAGCLMVAARSTDAQGALTTQGFGYPGGELSSRSLATGGALGDFDPNSPLNPASLAAAGRAAIYIQYDPEFRSVAVGGVTANTLTGRFPVFGISGRLGRATFGLSLSNYLDRTWVNNYPDSEKIGGVPQAATVVAQSSGGISDIRMALAWTFSSRLHVGVGFHVFPGENRTAIGRDFADTITFGSFTQADLFTFSGEAVSVGVLATPIRHWNVAGAARFGGTMNMRVGDSTIVGTARVPNKWSLSVAYDGFAGSALGVHYGQETWSSLNGLGNPGLPIHDATEFGIGGEVAGPKVGPLPMAIRLGYRDRGLPVSLDATAVKESAFTGGIGIPVANGRGMADITIDRAHRTGTGVVENAWIISFGFSIKP